ncbi:MAG: C cytochrome precursor, partial [Pirellulales bacterium]|nr:C cytochrome precursor [Pirellulales bacterium]
RQPIVMMTGSHHAQGYWFPSGEGRDLKRFPFMYRIDQGRWITDRANFLIKPAKHGLANTAGVWNHLCDRCHTTHPQPRLEENGNYDTHVAEFGIACESCHGPGAAHAQSIASGEGSATQIVNPLSLSPRQSAEMCGQCHAETTFKTKEAYFNWAHHGDYYRPGESLEDYLKIKDTDVHAFWQDGMVRISGREFNGLVNSPCFAHNDPSRQMSCLSCHVMHQPADDPRSRKEWANDQLKLSMDSNRPGLHNNQACTQCHAEYTDEEKLTAHTHHAPTSTGSVCYNCHMPHSTWGLMKAMRSHTISSPNVEESLSPVGRPNACNLCHLDKTLLWTAEKLHQQYDQPIPQLNEEQRDTATGLLWGLQGDAAQRALIAWNMGWLPARETSGTDWMVPLLAQLLVDPYDAVRSRAALTLRTILGDDNLDYDFLAPEADREAAQADVLRNWEARAMVRKGDVMSELLLKPNGQLDQERFDRLLRWRDDREVFLSE